MLKNQNKLLITFLLSTVLSVQVFCQNPTYHNIGWEKDGYIFGALMILGGLEVLGTEQFLSVEEVNSFDRATINAFDRGATYNNSESAASASDFCRNFATLAPISLLLLKDARAEIGKIGFMFLEVGALNTTAALVAKKTVRRVRPLVYNENVDMEEKLTASANRSFYSGHTAHVSAFSFFAAKVYSDLYPDSKWKTVAWAGAASFSALAGYFRYEAGRHFPTDIIAGYGIGAAIGILVPQLHKIKKDNFNIGITPIGNGATMNLALRF